MNELTTAIHEKVKYLCAEGDSLAEENRFAQALEIYWQAFDLIPEPKTNWEATTWVLVAIGDTNFLNNDFQAGRDNLSNAMHCPNAIGNPFIHLRLGQCQLELGNHEEATDELIRAYMGNGSEVFKGEDPKYYEYLKNSVSAPPNGWEE